jgi:hypothetical protein
MKNQTQIPQANTPRLAPGPHRGNTIFSGLVMVVPVAILASGCTVLTYTGPNGERFSRSSLGTSLAIASLSVESGTNGLRRVELQGYQNDAAQALGTVTEAAVRAALERRP